MWWLKPYLSIKVLDEEQRGTKKKKKDKVKDEAFGRKKIISSHKYNVQDPD